MKKLNLKRTNHLILAGSKISFSDIQTLQTDLPLHSRKYYKAEDVDDVFIVINGVLTDVSEHAFRNDKLLSEHRELLEQKDKLIDEYKKEIETLREMLNSDKLVEQNRLLKQELVNKQNEFDTYKNNIIEKINTKGIIINDINK